MLSLLEKILEIQIEINTNRKERLSKLPQKKIEESNVFCPCQQPYINQYGGTFFLDLPRIKKTSKAGQSKNRIRKRFDHFVLIVLSISVALLLLPLLIGLLLFWRKQSKFNQGP